jgi:hypothetical protein
MRHREDFHASNMRALLNTKPFSDWFESKSSMLTGGFYAGDRLDSLLRDAKYGRCRYVQVLGRLINQELACRYVDGQGEIL